MHTGGRNSVNSMTYTVVIILYREVGLFSLSKNSKCAAAYLYIIINNMCVVYLSISMYNFIIYLSDL